MTRKESNAVLAERIENMHEDVREIMKMVRIQNGRVRKLENWRNILTGAGAVIIAMISYGIVKLNSLFR